MTLRLFVATSAALLVAGCADGAPVGSGGGQIHSRGIEAGGPTVDHPGPPEGRIPTSAPDGGASGDAWAGPSPDGSVTDADGESRGPSDTAGAEVAQADADGANTTDGGNSGLEVGTKPKEHDAGPAPMDDASGAEAGGQDTGGAEAGGQDAGGAEAGAQDTGGAEAGGQDTGGAEAGAQDAGGAEAGGQDTGGADDAGSAPEASPTDDPDGGGDDEPALDPDLPWPGEAEVVLTEIMRAPEEGPAWIEVRSLGDGPRRLHGCLLEDAAGNAASLSGDEAVIEAGGHALLAPAGEALHGLPAPDATFEGLDLGLDGLLVLTCGEVVVDAVDTAGGGGSFPSEPGRAMQLDPAWLGAEDNDAAEAWCDAFLWYGSGYGTPRTANLPCDAEVDWCRLWYPGFATAAVGEGVEVVAHLREAGITDQTPGQPTSAPGLRFQVGVGPDGEHPGLAPEAFQWTDGAAVEDPPAEVPDDEDRYAATVTVDAPGVYDLAARFTLDGGFTWQVCDLDGTGNGYQTAMAGYLSVTD